MEDPTVTLEDYRTAAVAADPVPLSMVWAGFSSGVRLFLGWVYRRVCLDFELGFQWVCLDFELDFLIAFLLILG